jgi:hypothetical protein
VKMYHITILDPTSSSSSLQTLATSSSSLPKILIGPANVTAYLNDRIELRCRARDPADRERQIRQILAQTLKKMWEN